MENVDSCEGPIPDALPCASAHPKSSELPSYDHLLLVTRIAKCLATAVETEPTLRQILTWLADERGLQRGVISLRSGDGDVVAADVTVGIEPAVTERMRYRSGEGITGQVFLTGKSICVPNLAAAPTFLNRSGLRSDLDMSRLALFCVPILDRGAVIATISADKDNSVLSPNGQAELTLLEDIGQLLAPFLQRRRLEDSLELFQRLRSTEGALSELIGRSSAMEEIRRLIAKVAPTNTSVLVTGETGTGKGVVAKLIHALGPRSRNPFVEVNCGAIPETLLESELFGHERGAFTGAHQRRIGVLERAGSGTVFLDEIGELTLGAQTKLLRVLQTRQFERVGGNQTIAFDARIVAATNRDLAAAIEENRFRSDLFYRLSVFPIHVPPLRERGKADIMLLADSFILRFSKEMGKQIFRIDTPAIDMITAYHWPGNVRELENVIERAVVLSENDVIHGHHMPPSLQMNRYAPAASEAGDFRSRVANFEMELIVEALKDTNGNQTKAAERLGITKRIIQYKISHYDIDWQRFF